jgi:predicted SAM-dependent methyltransferase
MIPHKETWKHRLGESIYARFRVTRFFVELVRTEVRASLVGLKNALLPWRRRRIRRLRRQEGARVNVACGPFPLSGFVNLDLHSSHPDVIEYDCRWSLPFRDAAVTGIRVEHFFEHLETRQELPAFLADCHRVLGAGGVLRIVVPDTERYLRAYCDGADTFEALGVPSPFPEDLPTALDIVNHAFHQWHEHRWGYDFETLEHRLRRAGFASVERMEYQRSLDEELAVDRNEHALYSLYVDAVK